MRLLVPFIFLFVQCLAVVVFAQKTEQVIHIGFLFDPDLSGERDEQDGFRELQSEIQRVVGRQYQIRFREADFILTKGEPEAVQNGFNLLNQRTDVDMIIAVGPVSATVLGQQKTFSKPCISVGVIDREAQNLPWQSGYTGVPNYTYLSGGLSMEKNVNAFHQIFPFRKLAFLLPANDRKAYDVNETLRKLMAPLQADFQLIFYENELVKALAEADEGVDAVFLFNSFDMKAGEMKPFAEELIRRKLPSMSLSSSLVQGGIMAAVGDENDRVQIIRRMALLVEAVLLGEDIAKIPVQVSLNDQILLNATTLERINLAPDFAILYSAKLLNGENEVMGEVYDLKSLLLKGFEENLDLQIQRQEVALSLQNVEEAEVNLFPSVDASANLVQIDQRTAENGFGQAPEQKGT
ncbi:MAG: ABC transporter substrate binding protein, partial [Bacteroidota bacterium]